MYKQRFKNISEFKNYLTSRHHEGQYQFWKSDIEKLFSAYEKYDIGCPQCGKKIVLGRVDSRGFIDLCCSGNQCHWSYTAPYDVMADWIIENSRSLENHKHIYTEVANRKICIICGEWDL